MNKINWLTRLRGIHGQIVIAAVLTTLLCSCGSGGDEDDGGGPPIPVTNTDYIFTIEARQVIEGAAAGSGSGSADFRTAAGEDIVASGTVTLSGITATSVGIHAGYAGETGPAIVQLESAGSNAWRIPNGMDLDQTELFQLQGSGYYVAVESPGGRLRGQILPPDWTLLITDLTGESVVPPVASSGTAKAGFAIHENTGTYHVRITTSGIGDAVGASIREGFAGSAGDVVLTLEQSSTSAAVWGSRDINNVNAVDHLTTSGLERYLRGAFYLSIETMSAIDGELRSQLLPDGVSVFTTELTDEEVVTNGGPPVTSAGTGVARVTYRPDTADFAVTVTTDLAALSVFVHQAEPGQIGPGLFSLTPDVMVPGTWRIATGTMAVTLTPEQQQALDDQLFYVNVTTMEHTGGELRGQIMLEDRFTVIEMSIGGDSSMLALTDPGRTHLRGFTHFMTATSY